MSSPRWMIGYVQCDHREFLSGVRAINRPILAAVEGAGISRCFYELAVHTNDILFYGARWAGLTDDAALERFENAIKRNIPAPLKFRVAQHYTGLPIEVFGGAETIPTMEDVCHWSSRACLDFIHAADGTEFSSGRFLVAMLLSDAILNCAGYSSERKVRLLTEWHEKLLARAGKAIQEIASEISYSDLKKLYSDRRAYWHGIFRGDSIDLEVVRKEVNPVVFPILVRFIENLESSRGALKTLQESTTLTRPFDDFLMRRLVHLNFDRLNIYNQYELMFLHLLKLIHQNES